MKWTLIYFDDQYQNIEALKELLDEKFNVVGCTDATLFTGMLQVHNPAAILIDVHMPVLNGHELHKKIVEYPTYNNCPIFFISGDQSDENKIKSYSEGGVDFLGREIRPEELIARITNKVKYFLSMSTKLELGNLSVDFESMRAFVNGKQVELTLLEFRLLSHILRIHPEPILTADIILKVWGDSNVKPGTLNTHFTNLKSKIPDWDHSMKVRKDQICIQKNL